MREIPDFETLMKQNDRREFLSRNAPKCPRCSAVQVQLIDYLTVRNAKWRCRICTHLFHFEPLCDPGVTD